MNKSFMKMHEILEDSGVTNNMFMFKLIDKSLSDVDPWHPKNKEEENAVVEECCRNVWYFLREVVTVDFAEDKDIPFALNIGGLAQVYLYERNINSLLMTCRQVGGKTTLLHALFKHSMIRGTTDTDSFSALSKKFPKINIPEYLENHIQNNKRLLCLTNFVDDFMFHVKDAELLGDSILVANGTIGPYHGNLLAATIPFKLKDFDCDLNMVEQVYNWMAGPLIYRINFKAENLTNGCISDYEFNQLITHLRDAPASEDAIRREIDVVPNWSAM